MKTSLLSSLRDDAVKHITYKIIHSYSFHNGWYGGVIYRDHHGNEQTIISKGSIPSLSRISQERTLYIRKQLKELRKFRWFFHIYERLSDIFHHD